MSTNKMQAAEQAQPLLLFSHLTRRQYVRGVPDSAAEDAEGRIWYRAESDSDGYTGLSDEDWPEWPECVACGLGVDWLHDPHWSGNTPEYDANTPDGTLPDGSFLWLHDNPKCVKLVYPAND